MINKKLIVGVSALCAIIGITSATLFALDNGIRITKDAVANPVVSEEKKNDEILVREEPEAKPGDALFENASMEDEETEDNVEETPTDTEITVDDEPAMDYTTTLLIENVTPEVSLDDENSSPDETATGTSNNEKKKDKKKKKNKLTVKYISANKVNVRDTPSNDGSIVAVFDKGDKVKVVETSEPDAVWVKIKRNGAVGYVFSGLLTD